LDAVASASRRLLLVVLLAGGLRAAPGWSMEPGSQPAPTSASHDSGDTARAENAARAETDEGDEAHRFGFGLAVGYGHGVAPRSRQKGRDVGDVQLLAIDPHLRMVLARPGSGERWFHGTLDGLIEGSLLINFEPHTGYAGAVLAALRYRILPGRRLRPYAEAGIGIGSLAFDLQSQDDGFSFFLQAGAGVRWKLNDTLSLTGSVRWHHISNAQLRQPNNGIDDVLFLIGLEIW